MRAALAALLLLSACGSAEDEAAPASTGPRPTEFSYSGRWAATQAVCADGWWEFGDREVATAGELECQIQREAWTATGASLELVCVGEGMTDVETWAITRPEGGRMTVTRGTEPPVALEMCKA